MRPSDQTLIEYVRYSIIVIEITHTGINYVILFQQYIQMVSCDLAQSC